MVSSLEGKFIGWTEPSSTTEQEKQERTESMIKEAIKAHVPFKDCNISVYAKGSYPNNTNVRTDSDVDVAVHCHDVFYWEQETPETQTSITPYQGIWTPQKLRDELTVALRAKFPGQVNDSGSTALTVRSSSARVDADVVPCFDYRYYYASGGSLEGTRVFRKNLVSIENYPDQHLKNGKNKNIRTNTYYKKAVRILKRVENAMVEANVHREVPSFFVESLVYNCPDQIFACSTWTETVSGIIVYIWDNLQGDDEPSEDLERWLEANHVKYLFHPKQKWTRADGRDFAYAAWNYLGYGK